MTVRSLTPGERSLLRSVFEITIPIDSLSVATNDHNWGGADNSITPGNLPFISTQIWCADFSDKSVSDSDRGTFIHEFTHVWQYYHGITKLSAIWLAVRHLGDYSLAYPYDLSDNDDFTAFNIEQQASIVEDWWRLTRSMRPLNNVGRDKTLGTYNRFVDQMRGAGPPHTPIIVTMRYRH